NYIWKLHGTPDSVVSDRGSVFVSRFLKELYIKLDIKPRISMAYHPQTDGQTERVNQLVEGFLRTYVNYQQDNWAELLPFAEFAYNNAPHSSTGHSPFYASTGFNPTISVSDKSKSDVPAAHEVAERIKSIQSEVQSALQMAKDKD